jgi:hypothetical protein
MASGMTRSQTVQPAGCIFSSLELMNRNIEARATEKKRGKRLSRWCLSALPPTSHCAAMDAGRPHYHACMQPSQNNVEDGERGMGAHLVLRTAEVPAPGGTGTSS